MTTGNGASAEPKISDRSVKSLMRKRLNEFQADVLEYLACRLSGLGLILWRRASRFRQGFLNPAHEGLEPRRAIRTGLDEGLSEQIEDQYLMHGSARLEDGDIGLVHGCRSGYLWGDKASMGGIRMARADEGLPEILPTFRLDLFARAPAEADFSWETTDLSPRGL